ncbi:MAG TPA: glycogen synthase GlgA [Steroidobacteraceae bacterium]
MRVLIASSEIQPLAKTGGLADVCAGLASELSRLGAEVRLILPAYESALDVVREPGMPTDLGELLGVPARLILARVPGNGLAIWLVDCPALFRRPGTPYQDAQGADWPDNALRFGVFSHAIARVALGAATLDWRADIVHCHDWHTGLAPYLIAGRAERPHSVFTIHNAAFQGNFPLSVAPDLGLPREVLTPETMEFYGRLSFLKAGIRYAERLTTVSPTYARELLTPEFGCGLEGLIATRASDFIGILNGIDTRTWNPATDPLIAERYSSQDLAGKAACKAELQRENGLAQDARAPVVSFASRLTGQKMADTTLERLPRLLAQYPRLQFALLGSGERAIEEGFAELARRHPARVAAHIGYCEAREHRLHAGADILLHGSRFEPCGLAQMYAMRYGAVPIVRGVGGLADTVADEDTGFVFREASPDALAEGIGRAVQAYERGEDWLPLQRRAMNADFGWRRPARAYLDLYRSGA